MDIKWSEFIIRFFFPPKCIFCEDVLLLDTHIEICEDCLKKIPYTSQLDSTHSKDFYNRFYCLGEYSGILKDTLIKFKFSEKPEYYRALGEILANKLLNMTKREEFDIIVSVPLSKGKHLKRGYNQAWLLAKEIGEHYQIKSTNNLLLRIKETKSQKELSKLEREINLKDAFSLNEKYNIKDKNILLIDDIMTTGTTLKECCKVLKKHGANYITTAVIASGRKF